MKDCSDMLSPIAAIAHNNKYLLIDCGSDARHSLAAAGYSFNEIDNIFISHLHADHIGGLEWLGFSRLYDKEPINQQTTFFLQFN